MKIIAYTIPEEEGLKLLIPTQDFLNRSEMEELEVLELLKTRHIPENAENVQIINDTDVPQDRTFRDAWQLNGEVVDHNLDKAKNIKLDCIRQVRNEKLAKLDMELLKAAEQERRDDVKEIMKLKQELRDLPQTINIHGCQDIESIKNLSHPLLEDA